DRGRRAAVVAGGQWPASGSEVRRARRAVPAAGGGAPDAEPVPGVGERAALYGAPGRRTGGQGGPRTAATRGRLCAVRKGVRGAGLSAPHTGAPSAQPYATANSGISISCGVSPPCELSFTSPRSPHQTLRLAYDRITTSPTRSRKRSDGGVGPKNPASINSTT